MFPGKIILGVVTSWAVSVPDCAPANGDTAQLVIKAPGVAPVVVSSLDNDAIDFSFEIPADVFPASTRTAAYCQLFVTDASGRRSHIANGQTAIFPDFSAVNADFDPRSENQKILDAINAVIEGRASDDEAELEIGGAVPRKIKFISSSELLRLRDDYELRVRQELEAEHVAAGGKLYDYSVVRFIDV